MKIKDYLYEKELEKLRKKHFLDLDIKQLNKNARKMLK